MLKGAALPGSQDTAKTQRCKNDIRDIDSILMLETKPIREFFLENKDVPPYTQAMMRAMDELSVKYPKSWLLLDLLFFEEVSIDEIAETSRGSVSREAVRKDKSRAIARLRKILSGYPEFAAASEDVGDKS